MELLGKAKYLWSPGTKSSVPALGYMCQASSRQVSSELADVKGNVEPTDIDQEKSSLQKAGLWHWI